MKRASAISLSQVALMAAAVSFGSAARAQEPVSARERQLLDRIEALEKRLAAVEARVAPPPDPPRSPTGDSSSIPGFAAGTTMNVLLDGYYQYNFNNPIGRVNLLRAFDSSSNNFTLNQAAVAIERAADPAQGRRFGVRLDLMFGQATESLGGNPANEPRTAPYRNIFQAYGTYVVPLGTGLNVDFGRFASSLGMEGSFTKDQINYTRSLLFTALPFYHMGFRTSYKLSGSTTASWLLVNGLNQMEDFNGFKSNHFMLSSSLSKNLSWTGSYYVGRETPDRLGPRPDGRTHIADTYATLNATPKLTLAGEADYIVSRTYANSSPARLAGGAGYAKYQFAPKFSLAGRFEYLSDRGGYFSGATQSLKEGTVTAVYQPADGFQLRWELRHDRSNHPFFLTHTNGVLKQDQSTALMGLIWWFGGKQGAW